MVLVINSETQQQSLYLISKGEEDSQEKPLTLLQKEGKQKRSWKSEMKKAEGLSSLAWSARLQFNRTKPTFHLTSLGSNNSTALQM